MLKRVHISGFKSLVDVTVDLDPVTVLIGKSGTGKSNFIEALCFLRDFLADPRRLREDRGLYSKVHSWPQIAEEPHRGRIRFLIEFSSSALQRTFVYELRLRDLRVSDESLTVDGEVKFAITDRQWRQKPTNARLSDQLDHEQALLPRLYGDEYDDAQSQLVNGLATFHFGSDVLCGDSEPTVNGFLDQSASNFVDVCRRISNGPEWVTTKRLIAAPLRSIAPSLSSIEVVKPAKDSIAIVRQLDDRTITTNPRHESEGLRRMLATMLALYQSPSYQTLIFEEPEKGIYPGAISTLAEEFLSCPGQGRGQVLVTTHSPEFLNHFAAHQIRVFEMDGFSTRVGRLREDQRSSLEDQLLSPGELLTVTEPRIEVPAPVRG